jgi:hypothetical protein
LQKILRGRKWIILGIKFETMRMKREIDEEFYFKFYKYLEKPLNKSINKDFFIPEEGPRKLSYYYKYKDKFNKILLILVNSSFKETVFKEDDFFIFLENQKYGYTNLNTLEKKLIYHIQIEVDKFISSKYNYLFRDEEFYRKNDPFKSKKEFHFFIISKILENIEFEPYNVSFSAKKEFYLFENYFGKVMIQLKENFNSVNIQDLHREVIRLELLKEKYQHYYLDFSIKKIEKLILRLNVLFDKSNNTKEKFNLEVSPQKFSKLLVLFFKNNKTEIDEERIKKINQFISNCFITNSKYSAIANTKNNELESIDFLNRENFKSFIALLILLKKLKYIKEIDALPIQRILVSDLREINKANIGLSNNLRNIISGDLNNLSKDHLLKLTRLKTLAEIKRVLMY